MLIDWFTVGAQLLNFIILIWLMKRFLYHPILQAIEAREKNISLELKEADDKKAEALTERAEFKKKNDEFEQNRVALVSKMVEEIKAQRQEQLEVVRKEANALMIKRQESLITNTENFYKNIKNKTEKEVFKITRKVLTELSTTTLEESICQNFILRLHDLSNESKQEFIESIKSKNTILRTCFNMQEDQRVWIKNAINDFFVSNISLQFETTPEIIGGIELVSDGKKISWSISDYLTSMEQSLLQTIVSTNKESSHVH